MEDKKIVELLGRVGAENIVFSISLKEILALVQEQSPKAKLMLTGSSIDNIQSSTDIDILITNSNDMDFPVHRAIEKKLRELFPKEMEGLTKQQIDLVMKFSYYPEIITNKIKNQQNGIIGKSFEIRVNQDAKVGITLIQEGDNNGLVHYYTGAISMAISLRTFNEISLMQSPRYPARPEQKVALSKALKTHQKLFSWDTEITVDADIRAAILEAKLGYTPLTPEHDRELSDKTKELFEKAPASITQKWIWAKNNHCSANTEIHETALLKWIARLKRWHGDNVDLIEKATKIFDAIAKKSLPDLTDSTPWTPLQKIQMVMAAVQIMPEKDELMQSHLIAQLMESGNDIIRALALKESSPEIILFWMNYLQNHDIKVSTIEKKVVASLLRQTKTIDQKIDLYNQLMKVVNLEEHDINIPDLKFFNCFKQDRLDMDEIESRLHDCTISKDKAATFFQMVLDYLKGHKSEVSVRTFVQMSWKVAAHLEIPLTEYITATKPTKKDQVKDWLTEVAQKVTQLHQLNQLLAVDAEAEDVDVSFFVYKYQTITKEIKKEDQDAATIQGVIKSLIRLQQISPENHPILGQLIIIWCNQVGPDSLSSEAKKVLQEVILEKAIELLSQKENSPKEIDTLTALIRTALKYQLNTHPFKVVMMSEDRWLKLSASAKKQFKTDAELQFLEDIEAKRKTQWILENATEMCKKPDNYSDHAYLKSCDGYGSGHPAVIVYQFISDHYPDLVQKEAILATLIRLHGLAIMMSLDEKKANQDLFGILKNQAIQDPHVAVVWFSAANTKGKRWMINNILPGCTVAQHRELLDVIVATDQITFIELSTCQIVMGYLKQNPSVERLKKVSVDHVNLDVLELFMEYLQTHQDHALQRKAIDAINKIKMTAENEDILIDYLDRAVTPGNLPQDYQTKVLKIVTRIIEIQPRKAQSLIATIDRVLSTELDEKAVSAAVGFLEICAAKSQFPASRLLLIKIIKDHAHLLFLKDDIPHLKAIMMPEELQKLVENVTNANKEVLHTTHFNCLVRLPVWLQDTDVLTKPKQVAKWLRNMVVDQYKSPDVLSRALIQNYAFFPIEVWMAPVSDDTVTTALIAVLMRAYSPELIRLTIDRHPQLLTTPIKNGGYQELLLHSCLHLIREDTGRIADIKYSEAQELLEKIRIIIERTPKEDLEKSDHQGYSWIVTASLVGDVKTLRVLAERGVDLGGCEQKGHTALSAAASFDQLVSIKYLVEEANLCVNVRDNVPKDQRFPVERAMKRRRHAGRKTESLDYLLSLRQLDLACVTDLSGSSPLQFAWYLSCMDIMKAVLTSRLKQALPITKLDRAQPNPLAIEELCVQALIEPELTNARGFSEELLIWMADHGVDFNSTEARSYYQHNMSTLMRLVAHRSQLDNLLPMAIKHGAIPEGDGSGATTALHELVKVKANDIPIDKKIRYFEQLLMAGYEGKTMVQKQERFLNLLTHAYGQELALLTLIMSASEDEAMQYLGRILALDQRNFEGAFTRNQERILQVLTMLVDKRKLNASKMVVVSVKVYMERHNLPAFVEG
jgi:predicted nucleotidyltransferase/ankyrin repeat protein